MNKKGKLKIDENFKEECRKAAIDAHESKELITLMNERVLSTKAMPPKTQKGS